MNRLSRAQSQRVELRGAPKGTLGCGHAQVPHDPVGAGVQKEAQLVGRRFGAGGAVSVKMRLPRLDMVLGLAAAAIDVFIEPARVAFVEIGDDEALIDAIWSGFGSRDDALDAAPAFRAVEEFLVAPHLARVGGCFAQRRRFGFESENMRALRRRRRDADDEVETVLAAKNRWFRARNNGYRRAAGSRFWANWRGCSARGGAESVRPLCLAGGSMAETKRPEPSKTTIG